MVYALTDEGRKYLKGGLPEEQLMWSLTKSMSTEEAKAKVPNFSIALQWAIKNKWVEIKDGLIRKIKDLPDKYELKESLFAAEQGKEIGKDVLSMLLSRRLLIEEKETREKKAEKFVGKEIANLTEDLIVTKKWKEVTFKPYNIESVGRPLNIGKRQPYTRFLTEVRRKLAEIGFKELTYKTIITEFWNFDALFQPQNHPARNWTDTYVMKNPKYGDLPDSKLVAKVKQAHEKGVAGSKGWGYKWDEKKASRLMPIAHDTAMSPAHMISGLEIPGKYFQIVRCHRPDVIDATHGVEFNQMGGFVIDENITFRHLLGLLKEFAKEMANTDKVRFYTDYFPFTEPSVQLSAKHPDLGWIEFGGAGLFREELTSPLDVKQPVIAWGLGIDRLAMFKLGITDIRELFSYKLDWLRNAKGI
ncbi:MAG: phenylalanine--tRNA ligase subunit alpha [Candidatus Aenigmarchaeota archaeon]|nr:phenylalanine--tRNA ligase subunit alpha [Candidatus Aenigmarchaeota archaeon]